MRLTRVLAATATCAVMIAADLPAQLRPNRSMPARVNTNPRLLVATPHVNAAADSAAAVQVGDGMRRRLSGQTERWFNVVTREQMNEALAQYAYPVDAVLPPMVARTLATALQARTMVSSSMTRDASGRYTIQARLAGLNDDAGHLVTLVQAPGQRLEDFGEATANALVPAFRALPDAKACMDQSATATDKAVGEAQKALRTLPQHGLASYCLGEIALARQQQPEAITRFSDAVTGDSLSLKAWNQLAILYQLTRDSSRVVSTYQQMLRVAPTNQALREEAFKLFIGYGQPGAAQQVAEEGLAIDPQNAELWDLKSNACLYVEDYKCAIDALEQVFANDSTKADTTYFQKITFAASRQPDTTRFLQWSRAAVRKYPSNPYMLEQLIQAYGYAGPIDSVVAVTRRLVGINTEDMQPVIRAIQALGSAGRRTEMLELGAYIDQHGTPDDKQNFAIMLVQAVAPLVQAGPQQDLPLAADMMRRALPYAPAGSQLHPSVNFYLGAATFFQIPPLDQRAEAEKSCEVARQMQSLLDEAGPALTAGRSAAEQQVTQWLGFVDSMRPRISSMINAYCR